MSTLHSVVTTEIATMYNWRRGDATYFASVIIKLALVISFLLLLVCWVLLASSDMRYQIRRHYHGNYRHLNSIVIGYYSDVQLTPLTISLVPRLKDQRRPS